MKYAVCIVPLAPVRLTADHRAEMSTQYLFGETSAVLETLDGGWLRLEDSWDGYTGFCRNNQFIFTDEPCNKNKFYTGGWVNEIVINNKITKIPYGSSLGLLTQNLQGIQASCDGEKIDGGATVFNEQNIKRISSVYLNTAYVWGGRSVFGIDCSGFAQMVYRMMNIKILRDANQQVNEGAAIGFLQEVVCGDLAFFDDPSGAIVHVGILLNDHEIIHSSGNVRIDRIDNEGIIHSETGLRTHHLRTIKRIA